MKSLLYYGATKVDGGTTSVSKILEQAAAKIDSECRVQDNFKPEDILFVEFLIHRIPPVFEEGQYGA